MSTIWRAALMVAAAIGFMAGGPAAVQAQTKPTVTTLGPDFPKSAFFVGNSCLAGIDEPTARFLQNVAWETVQDYYGK
jgi:hypothetical protein